MICRTRPAAGRQLFTRLPISKTYATRVTRHAALRPLIRTEFALEPSLRQRRHEIAVAPGHVVIGHQRIEDRFLHTPDHGVEERIDVAIRDKIGAGDAAWRRQSRLAVGG